MSGERKHRDACRSTRKMRCCHRARPTRPAAATQHHANHHDRIFLMHEISSMQWSLCWQMSGKMFATCVSHGECTSHPRKVSPHGHYQAGAQNSFDRACTEAEKCNSNLSNSRGGSPDLLFFARRIVFFVREVANLFVRFEVVAIFSFLLPGHPGCGWPEDDEHIFCFCKHPREHQKSQKRLTPNFEYYPWQRGFLGYRDNSVRR